MPKQIMLIIKGVTKKETILNLGNYELYLNLFPKQEHNILMYSNG